MDGQLEPRPGAVRVLFCPQRLWYNGVSCLPIFPIFRHDPIFDRKLSPPERSRHSALSRIRRRAADH